MRCCSCGCLLRRALRDGEPREERERKEMLLPLLTALGSLAAA
eukprot:gene52-198_t